MCMHIFKKAILSIAILGSIVGNAQNDSTSTTNYKHMPAIGLGVGIVSFSGDVGSNSSVNALSNFRANYSFSAEQRIGNFFGLRLNGTYGTISKNERSLERNLNFQSTLMGGSLLAQFHFDNNKITPVHSLLTPVIGVGAGYYMFDPYGDLKAANGSDYYYWTDGSIRDMEETDANLETANLISRDYDYETQLKDPNNNYDRSTLVFPISLGLRFNLTDEFSANFNTTYYITQTDYMDNLADGSNKDVFMTGNVSLYYHIGRNRVSSSDSRYDDVDFDEIDKKADVDEDGVNDDNDDCLLTPKGVSVDSKGCPMDTDNDGVPDYLDQEKNTAKDSEVDEYGRAINFDNVLLEYFNDSTTVDRENIRAENPELYQFGMSDETSFPDESLLGDEFKVDEKELAKVTNPNSKIPAKFQEADLNGDEYISMEEIYGIIDGFFDGSNNFDIERIHELIDFFFDQE